MCVVVNALFEFTLMLLFFKKIKIQKKKNQNEQKGQMWNEKSWVAKLFLGYLVTKFAWRPSIWK